MTGAEQDDLISLATEVEQLAFAHEKVIQRLDLGRARSLRDLARRIRAVARRGVDGLASGEVVREEVLGLRLEAMVALLSEHEIAPLIAPRRASGGEVVSLCRIRKKP